jgi:hypothetical protein
MFNFKKSAILLTLLFSILTPSFAISETEKYYLDNQGCFKFAEVVAIMAQQESLKHFKTPQDLFNQVFTKDDQEKALPSIVELMKVVSRFLVKDNGENPPELHYQGALQHCFSNQGDIEEMTNQISKYLGEVSI